MENKIWITAKKRLCMNTLKSYINKKYLLKNIDRFYSYYQFGGWKDIFDTNIG